MTKEQSLSSSYEKQLNSLLSNGASPHSTEDALPLTDDVNGIQTWRPPRLLLTLLGDYWWQRKEHLPSAALVSWLAEFGISDTAARAALSRLVHNDLLVTLKQGRQTFYKLSERAEHVLNDGVYRIFSFGLCLRSWDGMWSLVAFSIPEENRQLRHVLRDRLRWLGFAPLYDGLWISPHDNLCKAANQLAELSISTITMFRAHIMESTPITGLPQQAWDLDALRTQYEKFITMVAPLCERVHEEQFSPEEALLTRTRVMDVWRSFPTMDPDLPDEILPLDWPRARARQLFIETYDALGPLAQRRIQQIIARYAPDLAPMATYHRSDAWLVIEQANKPMPSL